MFGWVVGVVVEFWHIRLFATFVIHVRYRKNTNQFHRNNELILLFDRIFLSQVTQILTITSKTGL